MNALIYGDSQSGVTGRRLQEKLKADGVDVVRVTKSGKSTSYLASHAKANIARKWDEVFLFSGGNDSAVQADSLRKLLEHFAPSAKVYFLGLPPATKITNMALARKVWGSASSPSKFFPQTAAKREAKNTAYQAIAGTFPNVQTLDFRNAAVTGAVTQPSGVIYPSQPDGIHTAGLTASQVADHAMDVRAGGSGALLLLGAALVAGLSMWWKRKA